VFARQRQPPLLLHTHATALSRYRGTSLMRNSLPVGLYSRTMPWPYVSPTGGRLFLMSEVHPDLSLSLSLLFLSPSLPSSDSPSLCLCVSHPRCPNLDTPRQDRVPIMYSKRHLPCRAVEPSGGSNVIPRRARPGLAGPRPQNKPHTASFPPSRLRALAPSHEIQGCLAHKKTHPPRTLHVP